MLPPTSTSLLLLGQLLLVGLLCRLLGQGLQLEEAHPHQPVHRLFGPLELEAVKVRHVGLQLACCQLLGEGRLLPLGGDPFLLPGPADHLGGRRVGDAQLLARQPQVLQGHRLPGHPRRGTIHHGLHGGAHGHCSGSH
uniref:Putative secreted protein n=1 Tax=Ixodes ricinus TaxID=34613 RepID=A0A6B0USM7_IXORI